MLCDMDTEICSLFFDVIALFLLLAGFLPGWVASPSRNPSPLPWLGTGTDPEHRFYIQKKWRSGTRPRKKWPETIREDLKGLHLTWKDVLDAAEDRNR